MDGGAWWAAVHGVANSRTWLSHLTFTFHFHALEKEMAIYSSVLAWRIPGTEEPGGLPSMGSNRVRHDWSDLAAAKCSWQHGQRSPEASFGLLGLRQRHYFADKGPSSQSYGFSSGHVWMWELDYKESWAPKNWCFWNVVLEKTLESPLDCKEIKRINPKGNQSWIIIRRTDAVLKSYTLATWWEKLIYWKRPWCWERLKAGGEGDDRGWDGWLASLTWSTWVWGALRGVGDGQGSLACCSPWGYS